MSDVPGMIPTAKGRSRAKGSDNILRPFDSEETLLEKRGAPPRYSAVVWPLLFALPLAVVAPRLLEVFGTLDPWLARVVFPFALLAQRPEFGLNWEFGGYLPRVVLLLQFPLEGLLTMFNLRRRFSVLVAISQLIVIHLVGTFVLFLLIQGHSAHF